MEFCYVSFYANFIHFHEYNLFDNFYSYLYIAQPEKNNLAETITELSK